MRDQLRAGARIALLAVMMMSGSAAGQGVHAEPAPKRIVRYEQARPPSALESLWDKAEPVIVGAWTFLRPAAEPLAWVMAWPSRWVGLEPSGGGLYIAALLCWWAQVAAARILLWSLPGRIGGWYDARAFHLWLRVGILGIVWRRLFGVVIWTTRWLSQLRYRRPQREWMGFFRKMRLVYQLGDTALVGTLSLGPLRCAQPVGIPGIERGMAIVAAPGTGKTVHMEAMIGAMPRKGAALIAPDCDGAMCRALAPGLMRDGHRLVKYDPDDLVPEIPAGHWNLIDEIRHWIETRPGQVFGLAQVAAQGLLAHDSSTQPVFIDTVRIFCAGALLWTAYFEPEGHRNLMRMRYRMTQGMPEAARPGEHPVDAWLRVMAEKGTALDNGDESSPGRAIAAAGSVMPRRGGEDSTNSFWSTLLYQMAWIDDPSIAAMSKTSDILVGDLKSTNTVVFLVASLSDINKGRLAPWLRAYIQIVLYAFQKIDPEKKLKIPMTIYVDEAANTGRIELLPLAVSGFRKYGIRVVTVWQSLQGAMRAYPNDWRDLWGLSQCMIWMGAADPATLKYLAEEILGRTTRRERIEGTPWWKFWGERIKSRYVEKEEWLMDAAQCGQTLNPVTEQVIVTTMGLAPMILRRAKFYVDLPVWRHERLPGFNENILKAFVRHVVDGRRARALARGRSAAPPAAPVAAVPPADANEPAPAVEATFESWPVGDEEPTMAPATETATNAVPESAPILLAATAFDACFDPTSGSFPDAALRARVWEAYKSAVHAGGDPCLLLWHMAARKVFNGTERNKVFRHFMAELEALAAKRKEAFTQ